MRKLTQTRLHNPPETRGNCFPTCIACFLDKESPEEVIQIQENYNDKGGWMHLLLDWLEKEGWKLDSISGHQKGYYLVSGKTVRGSFHVCIYKDGKLWHDPHPSRAGLETEEIFETLKPKQ